MKTTKTKISKTKSKTSAISKSKTSKTRLKTSTRLKSNTARKHYEMILYALVIIIIIAIAYHLFGMLKDSDGDVVGQATSCTSDSNCGVGEKCDTTSKCVNNMEQELKPIILKLSKVDGTDIDKDDLKLTPANVPSTSSMHYNWLEKQADTFKSITKVNLPMELVTLKDISGNNNLLTLNGDSNILTGVVGKALSFDGLNNYVMIGKDNDFITLDGDFTIEFWFNTKTSLVPLFYNQNSEFEINIGADNKLNVGFLKDGSNNDISTTKLKMDNVIISNVWYHLVVVYDKTNNKLTLYINADTTTKKEIDYDTTIIEDLAGPFYIGYNSDLLHYFKGMIDEFRIYDRILTHEQIKTNFGSVRAKFDSDYFTKPDAYYNAYTTFVSNMANCGTWKVIGWESMLNNFNPVKTTDEYSSSCSVGCKVDTDCKNGRCIKQIAIHIKYDKSKPFSENLCVPKDATCAGFHMNPNKVISPSFDYNSDTTYENFYIFDTCINGELYDLSCDLISVVEDTTIEPVACPATQKCLIDECVDTVECKVDTDCKNGRCVRHEAINGRDKNLCVTNDQSLVSICKEGKATNMDYLSLVFSSTHPTEADEVYTLLDGCYDNKAYDFSCSEDADKVISYTPTTCPTDQNCYKGKCVQCYENSQCAVGEVCTDGACVPQQTTSCNPACTGNDICYNNKCMLGLEEDKVTPIAIDATSCITITLETINLNPENYDFKIGPCECMDATTDTTAIACTDGKICENNMCISPPTVTINNIKNDLVAEMTYPVDVEDKIGSVHYNWYNGTDANYESMTVVNLPMDEQKTPLTNPTNLPDLAGKLNNVVSDLPTFSDGVVGRAVSFDGVDDSIAIGNELLILDEDFTIEMWFNSEADEGTLFRNEHIKQVNNINQLKENVFVILLDDDKNNKNYLSSNWFTDNLGTKLLNNVGDVTFVEIEKNKWNHLTVTYSKSLNIVQLYLNGNLAAAKNYGNTKFGALKGAFYIDKFEEIDLFKGKIDEFKIYNRTLSEEQIKANYDSVMEEITNNGVITSQVKTTADKKAYNKIVSQENKACRNWKVVATMFDTDGKLIESKPEDTTTISDYCSTGVCSDGKCVDAVNCINTENCASNSVNQLCKVTTTPTKNDGTLQTETSCTNQPDTVCVDSFTGCDTDTNSAYANKCVYGVCVECLTDADCSNQQQCTNNQCVVIVNPNTPPTPPSSPGGSGGSGGSGGGHGGSDLCMMPENPVACNAQKAYTPCVGGKIIYTCISNCNTSLLFQYDCIGNVASFASGCNNKVNDIGEEGIDCGGHCANKCPDYCFNQKKDGDEYGVDCGGKKCKPCVEIKPVAPVKAVAPPVVMPIQPKQPVEEAPKSVDESFADKLIKFWWTLIPLFIIIGLILFLVSRKHKPHEEMMAGIVTKPKSSVASGKKALVDMPKIEKMPNLSAIDIKPKISKEEQAMKTVQLKDFVKKELGQGKSKEQITKDLERLGYKTEDISTVFGKDLHKALPKQYEEQIRKYVAYYLDKGDSAAKIREQLKKQGWSDDIVDKFLVR
ncbi:MAG: LamG domain-containing protein [Candidatus Woesearchaeota archaeon]